MLFIKIPLQRYFLNCFLSVNNSLRRQRFRAVLEQRTRNESQMARVKELSFNFSRGQNRKSRSLVFLPWQATFSACNLAEHKRESDFLK